MDYDQIRAIRATNLKTLALHSPLHYRHAVEHEGDGSDDTSSRVWLRAVHAAVLEGDTFYERYGVYPGAVRRGKEYDAWRAETPGRIALLRHEMDSARAIAEAIYDHPEARRIAYGLGGSERVLTWDDHGSPCKCKIDRLTADPVELWDLKTVSDVTEGAIRYQMRRLRWDLQMAHYLAGCRANGIEPERVGLVVVEDSAPHDVGCYVLSPLILQRAEEERQELLATIRDCEKYDRWPGVCPGVSLLTDDPQEELNLDTESDDD